jgi:nitrate/nitrite transporter NarK
VRVLLALVFAGESIFLLPFVLARVFRPTLLDVFGITNLQLGIAFSIYGLVAMFAYFGGGPLADRFRPRLLLAAALLLTAAGGWVFSTGPSIGMPNLVYGYWGLTTIALFWAALIRATREWGEEEFQGAAFGLLDGGRGLVAAGIGTAMVALYAMLLPEDPVMATAEQRSEAFAHVIGWSIGAVCLAAGLILLVLPERQGGVGSRVSGLPWRQLGTILRMPSVWLQAIIILCAYAGFKAADVFSLYANEVLALDEVDAARTATVSLWVRPFAAVGAGYLADRRGAARMTGLAFGLLLAGSAVLASGQLRPGMLGVFLLTIISTSMAIFALRGIYFALMQEGGVPLAYTGSAVGFVSFIGFTPDVFMGPLMGWLLDGSPGTVGHQHVFIVVMVFSIAGLMATLAFSRHASRPPGKPSPSS